MAREPGAPAQTRGADAARLGQFWALAFGGEMFLPWSKPQRLGRTPHSGTQVPQRLLTRLRRGRLRIVRLTRVHGADSRSCGVSDELRRPHCAPGLFAPLRCANGLPLRCGRRSSSDDPPGRARRSRNAPAKAVTLRAARRPAKVSWPLLSLRGNSGEASRRPSGKCHLARARPRSFGAEPGKERGKGVPLLLGALRACAAPRRDG